MNRNTRFQIKLLMEDKIGYLRGQLISTMAKNAVESARFDLPVSKEQAKSIERMIDKIETYEEIEHELMSIK